MPGTPYESGDRYRPPLNMDFGLLLWYALSIKSWYNLVYIIPLKVTGGALMRYETYENRNNPHITIHKDDCTQLRKRGGDHQKSSKGEYHQFTSLEDARAYAKTTELPIKECSYCMP